MIISWLKNGHAAAVLLFLILTIVFFRNYFFLGLLPIPFDIVTGIYYPWRDYAWGYGVAVPVRNSLPSDIPSQLYPFKQILIEIVKSGHWPLWNPFVLSGTPLLANFQTTLFYPTTLLYFFLSLSHAWSISIILQPLTAMLCMYLFLFAITKSKIASAFGAIVYAFCGFSVVWFEYNTISNTITWLPFILFASRKFAFTRDNKWLFAIALAVCLQVFTGYPLITLYSLFICASYAIFTLWEDCRLGKLSQLIKLLISIGLGLGLSAIQLLPGFEFIQLSNRYFDNINVVSAGGFLPLKHFITILVPDFFGHPATQNYRGVGFYDNFAFYVGILPLLLAWFAWYTKPKREMLFFLAGFFASFVLIIKSPISEAFFNLNILGLRSTIPARLLFFTDFCLAFLASLGLAWLINQKQHKVSFWKIIKPSLIIGGILLATLTILGVLLFTTKQSCATDALACQKNLQSLTVSIRNMVFPLAFFICALILFIGYWKARSRRPIIIALFFLLVIADLFRFGNKYLSFTPQRLAFPETKTTTFLQEHAKIDRINGGEVIPNNMWVPYHLYSAAGYDAFYPLRYAQFLAVIKGDDGKQALGRYGEIVDYERQLADLTGTKYILALKWTPQEEVRPWGVVRPKYRLEKFEPIFEENSVVVLENKTSFPRTFLVSDYQVRQSNTDLATVLKDPTINLRKTVVLEKPIKEALTGATGSATIMHYQPNSVTIKTVTDGAMLLFLSDTFFPGWVATVDGSTTDIMRADFTFRAIVVPSGEHELVFRYQPKSFAAGLKISLAVLALLVVYGARIILQSRITRWKKF